MTTLGQKRRDLKSELRNFDKNLRNDLEDFFELQSQITSLVRDYNRLAEQSGINSRLAFILGEGDDILGIAHGSWFNQNANYMSYHDEFNSWFPSTQSC